VNVVRVIPSLPGYVYAVKGDDIYVNLFVGGTATIKTKNNTVKITQETRYPWDGQVRMKVEPARAADFKLHLRVPGWEGKAWPTELYAYPGPVKGPAMGLTVNGDSPRSEVQAGYFAVAREWKAGDTIEYALPMMTRRVHAHQNVADCRGRVAIMRGPIVYCAEGIDNGGHALDLVLPDDAQLSTEHRSDLLGGVTVIKAKGRRAVKSADGKTKLEPAEITLIPYYAWAHRGKGEMTVWLPRTPEALTTQPAAH
jgi:DUF1680 family protein